MRIAYIITRSDEVGGAHVHVRDLAAWMIKNGHDVKVFVGGDGVYLERLSELNIAYEALKNLVRPISPISDCKAIFELVSALKKFNPDLVSIHSAKAGLIGRIACRLLNLKCVFTAHGWSFADGVNRPMRDVYKYLERFFSGFSKKIITVCQTDKLFALQNRICVEEKLIAINNGMPDINKKLIADHRSVVPKLIMIARFEAQKDHFSLINALAELKHKKWTLDLVGEGPLVDEIKDLVDKLDLSNRVFFLGRRWDVPELLSQANIFLLISFWEGFPRSIIEAMRASLPVIATNVAGVNESVDNGVTGYLVEKGNIEEIKNALDILISNPDARQKMGAAGRVAYDLNFTFDIMANKTFNVYSSILNS